MERCYSCVSFQPTDLVRISQLVVELLAYILPVVQVTLEEDEVGQCCVLRLQLREHVRPLAVGMQNISLSHLSSARQLAERWGYGATTVLMDGCLSFLQWLSAYAAP